MHVRGGDYLKLADTFVQLGSGYYQRALATVFRAAHPAISVAVFTNDPPHARAIVAQLVSHFPRTTFHLVSFGSAEADQVALASCDHVVLSNSTFAWWAGWSCAYRAVSEPDHPPCIVTRPSGWFSNGMVSDGLAHPRFVEVAV